jgi:hypothetical protein
MVGPGVRLSAPRFSKRQIKIMSIIVNGHAVFLCFLTRYVSNCWRKSAPLFGVILMTAPNPLLAGIEQLLLLIFIVMTLVAMAGSNPTAVLSPMVQICTRLLVAIISLSASVLLMLFKALIGLIPAISGAASKSRNASFRRFK